MDSIEVVEEAVKELKMQQRLIKKQRHLHDPTLYRMWVAAVIPSLIPVLEKALESLKWGESEANLIEEILLSYKIIGHKMQINGKTITNAEQYDKAVSLS